MSELLFLILAVVLGTVGMAGPVFLGWNAMIGLAMYAAVMLCIPLMLAGKKN